jgi:phenylalanyl-tRNA synthetase alpha chain
MRSAREKRILSTFFKRDHLSRVIPYRYRQEHFSLQRINNYPWYQPSKPFSTSQDCFREYKLSDPNCNVTPNIAARIGKNLHLKPKHPLNIIKTVIEDYWNTRSSFVTRDDLDPIVSTQNNFDSLLIQPDHVSRSKSDTYYFDKDTVLRTHTSAHQTTLLKEGIDRFLVTGDVYRRDEIDSSHYPIFHQMEGVRMFSEDEFAEAGALSMSDKEKIVEQDLKDGLEGMAKKLFGDVEMRWVDAYFPFTDPSYELEIYFNDEWLEVLGCGVVHKDIVKSVERGNQLGWAFGLGLERLAMVLFSIPDIRLFWSEDERFHRQFQSGDIVTFEPYSKYPPCFKDISFWTSEQGLEPSFHPNDLNEVVRDVAGDLAEKVELIDEFKHPKTNRISNCFRISYRSMDRSLTNEEIDSIQEGVRQNVVTKLGVELR